MKRKFTKYPQGYIRANSEPTGYWMAVMRYYPDNGKMQEYNAFTTGYTEDEARLNLRTSDLVGEEKDDQIFCLTPISQSEFENGCERYHTYGERWR